MENHSHRPRITLVASVTLDGKLSDFRHVPAHFGSSLDSEHLHREIARADAVLLGAGTLRAYGSTWIIDKRELIQSRCSSGLAPQPVHIVCSYSAEFAPGLPFFRQTVERWLLTSASRDVRPIEKRFDRIIRARDVTDGVCITDGLATLADAGIRTLVVLAGGRLNAALFAADCVDNITLTLCPMVLGGATAPTLADGPCVALQNAKRFRLTEVSSVHDEVFLRYQRVTPNSLRDGETP
jgi:riboflavin biosynthesis pyrimidine reductase